MARTLTDEDIDAIAEAVVAKQRAAQPATVATSADDIITAAEVMTILRIGNAASLCRMLKKLRVRRLGWNRYRRGDIENAIARATTPPRQKTSATA